MYQCEFCFELNDSNTAMRLCPHCGFFDGMEQKDPRYLTIGTMVNSRYIIGGAIGDGGFGFTYRAWDTKLQTVVALKEFFQSGVVNRVPGTKSVFIAAKNRAEEFLYGKERLLREARIVSRFQSSSIVRIHDFFEENGTSYMVMEFLDCPTLEEVMHERGKPLSDGQISDIGIQLCDALDEIHQAHVLHRDIAPDNIFIDEDGRVKIIDFGSAHLPQEEDSEKLISVKEGFSPVEQYEKCIPGQKLQGPWTDIYSLGATLYYCAAYSRPWEATRRRHESEKKQSTMPEPKERNPAIAEDINNTIMKAMAIDSHERFADAGEMKRALKGEVKAKPLALVRKKKRRVRTLSITIALLLAAVAVILAVFNGRRQYSELVLNQADISVWYCTESGDELSASYLHENQEWVIESGEADKKGKTLLTVIGRIAGSVRFSNITVSVRGIPKELYQDTLTSAAEENSMPAIFECLDSKESYMEKATDISTVFTELNSNTGGCWFLEDNISLFEERKAMPTGFVIPVIYINTAVVGDSESLASVDSMAAFALLADGEMQYKPVAVDEAVIPLYRNQFEDFDSWYYRRTEAEREDFLSDRAAAFLSSSSPLVEIQQALAGMVEVCLPFGEEKTAQFKDYWSMGATLENEAAAAAAMLACFYSDWAQESMYAFNDTGVLPLNKSALSEYLDVYGALGGLKDSCGQYTFPEYLQ